MGERKAREAGNLALVFEKPAVKGGDVVVVLQYQDGKSAVKERVGVLRKGEIETEVGDIECWAFLPEKDIYGPEIKKRRANDIKLALNRRLFENLAGYDRIDRVRSQKDVMPRGEESSATL